ncbi:DUF3995 domain-containing protein [Mycetocola manganoxydans]|uniref:DUF3995 domain-containing protein n=1 Tax=Mycetocola manganoxydans TaxID=699879 RepID=A0A3L6ZJW7_9MICO|nr:DUF3995 domain-containing protein [Mycetocola manganoxydans]RLP68279.1 DUF3995 domain-containing protein [Mycetocola manganoxydans]GHD52493.1 hypothetical protein GCM10008097_28420 [Mycetocola manganoxydans]
MSPSKQFRAAHVLVWTAGVVGILHAAASLYWAVGGQWLAATAGQWALDLSVEAPVATKVGLGFIALLKFLAAIIPVAVAYGRVPGARFWRSISWVGGILLIAYGGLNTILGAVVLAGLITPDGGYDRAALMGHALLWNPLFFIWGAALILSLWFSRHDRRRSRV